MNNNDHKQPRLSLDELLVKMVAGNPSRSEILEFPSLLEQYEINPKWVKQNLESAYSELNVNKILLLLDCVSQESFRKGGDTQEVASVLCRIMEDSRCYDLAEEIADILGDFILDKSALSSFVKVCTSSIWEEIDYWPDLRKALYSMYGIYQKGSCTKEEAVAAFQEILNSPNVYNECRGIRELAQHSIEMLNEPLKNR